MFTGKVTEMDGSYYIQLPDDEVQYGSVDVGSPVSVSLTSTGTSRETNSNKNNQYGDLQPPVEQGDLEEVTIEDMGDQGDGIARIDGYVVIVPNTDVGETVTVRIKDVNTDYAYAVIEDAKTVGHE